MTCFCFPCGESTRSASDPALTIDPGAHNIKFYAYKELQLATDNFSKLNKIGEGGFGPVYKGKLRDGTMVAVKVLSPESRQGLREFVTEITILADVDHENLVKLIGCCVERNNRILVSGYLENNSLAQTLLGQSHNTIDFSWSRRRKISIDIAKGLAFLHEEVDPHIIHRDIKASNILLDVDLTAKITDFGMAKLIPENMTHVSTKVAGTLGYLAPEYALRGQLTRKADIYSFGVLLMEIICGKCNRNKRLPPADQYLLMRAWREYQKGDLLELIDESFRADLDTEEASRFLKIGLICAQKMSNKRPPMSTVVKMLQGEVSVSGISITRPGMLSEVMDVRGSENPDENANVENKNGSSNYFPSSGTSSLPTDPTCATITFTSISTRTN